MKKIIIILIIAIVSILILNNLYIYKEIDNTYQGIEFSVNDSEYEKISVTLKGSYKKYLFKNPELKIELFIDGYEPTESVIPDYFIRYIGLFKYENNIMEASAYFSKDNDNLIHFMININKDFDSFLIYIWEYNTKTPSYSWNPQTGRRAIAFPANNHDEALTIFNELNTYPL